MECRDVGAPVATWLAVSHQYPETCPRLVALTSLWLDLLVLRLMNQGQPRQHPTWFVLDELASLQRLPQLHTAITENRKSNNPVVLGFQGRSQLETRYGHAPRPTLVATGHEGLSPHRVNRGPRSGLVTRSAILRLSGCGRVDHRDAVDINRSGLERQVEPLIMASEITGLAALRGWLKVGNLVVRMMFPFIDLPKKVPALLDRPRRPSRSHRGVAAAPDVPRSVVTESSHQQLRPQGQSHDPLFG